jgi:hypothetical protein
VLSYSFLMPTAAVTLSKSELSSNSSTCDAPDHVPVVSFLLFFVFIYSMDLKADRKLPAAGLFQGCFQ